MTAKVDIKALFEAGVHFGHKASHWNPKMSKYIHSKRQDGHIIDLEKTVEGLNEVLPFITKTVAGGKKVLFVGTKKHTKELVKAVAEATNQPYVTDRWLGGMLTNSQTVGQQIKKLKDLEKRMASGDLEKRYSKLEVQRYQEEIDDLNQKYGGIKELAGRPGAMVIVDTIGDANAVKEANVLGVPVTAIVDSNADPSNIQYVIPGNDDAIKGVQLILDYIKEAIMAGNPEEKAKKDDSKKEK